MPVRATPVSRSNYFYDLQVKKYIPINGPLNNCNNTLCFTWNHDYIYKPHTAYGMVGTTAAGYLGRRKRL